MERCDNRGKAFLQPLLKYGELVMPFVEPRHFLLKCRYQARKVSGHICALEVSISPLFYNLTASVV
jgi:hypothetical protein